jgi:hypothetical protein
MTFGNTAASLVRHGAARRGAAPECLDLLQQARVAHQLAQVQVHGRDQPGDGVLPEHQADRPGGAERGNPDRGAGVPGAGRERSWKAKPKKKLTEQPPKNKPAEQPPGNEPAD